MTSYRAKHYQRWSCSLLALLGAATATRQLVAAPWDPAASDYSGNKGRTIYVSKKGNNSDGSSWQKAFHTIIIRPDTYVEANLISDHPGAKGSYNLMVGHPLDSITLGVSRRTPTTNATKAQLERGK